MRKEKEKMRKEKEKMRKEKEKMRKEKEKHKVIIINKNKLNIIYKVFFI